MKLEEAIEELQEKIKSLDRHIKNYEKSDCKTKIYRQLVKEKEAIETILTELKKLQKDNYRLDRENQLLFERQVNSIPKKKIKDKLEELNEEFNNDNVDVNCSQDNYYELSDKYAFAEEKIQELLEG